MMGADLTPYLWDGSSETFAESASGVVAPGLADEPPRRERRRLPPASPS